MAPCADCGEFVGDVQRCPGCDSNMHAFCSIGVGDGVCRLQRICKKCAAPPAAPAAPATAATAAAARRRLRNCRRSPRHSSRALCPPPSFLPHPLTLRTAMLARNLHSLTRRAPASEWTEICTCSHFSQVVQTSATVNATRLKTHLSQLCQ